MLGLRADAWFNAKPSDRRLYPGAITHHTISYPLPWTGRSNRPHISSRGGIHFDGRRNVYLWVMKNEEQRNDWQCKDTQPRETFDSYWHLAVGKYCIWREKTNARMLFLMSSEQWTDKRKLETWNVKRTGETAHRHMNSIFCFLFSVSRFPVRWGVDRRWHSFPLMIWYQWIKYFIIYNNFLLRYFLGIECKIVSTPVWTIRKLKKNGSSSIAEEEPKRLTPFSGKDNMLYTMNYFMLKV